MEQREVRASDTVFVQLGVAAPVAVAEHPVVAEENLLMKMGEHRRTSIVDAALNFGKSHLY